ncbi:hypothetical protein V6Z12_A04G066900 [Gossypium hirsutum]
MASENLRGTKIATSRRRCSLFKKAAELSTLCGARVAIVVISKKGKVSMFPDSDTVIHRYINRKNNFKTSYSSKEEESMNNEVECKRIVIIKHVDRKWDFLMNND